MLCTVTRRGRAGRWPWGGVFSLCGGQGSCSESEEALKMGRQQFWGTRRGAPVLRGCGLEVPFFFLLDSAGRQEGSWGWLGRVRICTGLTASWAGKGTGDRTGDRRPAQGGRARTGEWAAQAHSVTTAVPSSTGQGPGAQPQSHQPEQPGEVSAQWGRAASWARWSQVLGATRHPRTPRSGAVSLTWPRPPRKLLRPVPRWGSAHT